VLTVEIKEEAPLRHIQWKTIGNIGHRYHGPAYTVWHDNGRKRCDTYVVNGEHHRNPSEGPAYTSWHEVSGRFVRYEDDLC